MNARLENIVANNFVRIHLVVMFANVNQVTGYRMTRSRVFVSYFFHFFIKFNHTISNSPIPKFLACFGIR